MNSFCGLLTLQVGVTVLSAVFLTLGAVVLVANLFEYLGKDDADGGRTQAAGDITDRSLTNKTKGDQSEFEGEEKSPDWYIRFIVVFSIMMFIVGGLAFCSAYSESRGLALMALLTLLLLTTFWIILCVLSFMGKPATVESICHEKRCPETLWLAKLDYRKEGGGYPRIQDGKKTHKKSEAKESFRHLLYNESKIKTWELNFEIEQILGELRKFNSCFKSCFDDDCIRRKEETKCNYCNSDISSKIESSKRIIESLLTPDILSQTINKKDITEFQKTLDEIQHQPRDHHSHLDTRQVVVRPVNFPGVGNVLPMKEETDMEKKITTDPNHEWETVTPKSTKRGSNLNEGTDFKFGLPLMAAVGLFVLNLLFFLFSLYTLWNWLQELGCGDCYYMDDCYYYY